MLIAYIAVLLQGSYASMHLICVLLKGYSSLMNAVSRSGDWKMVSETQLFFMFRLRASHV